MLLGMVSAYMSHKTKETWKSLLYLAVLHSSLESEKSEKIMFKYFFLSVSATSFKSKHT